MGILANSASVTHSSSTSDDTNAGYLNQEQITLSLSVAGSSFLWGLAKPVDSGPQAKLSATDTATVKLVPDVAGYYTVTCLVDGTTTYVLRISVINSVVSTAKEALRMQPVADAQVTAPAVGMVLYCGADHSNVLCVKDSAGNVFTVDVTAV